jgi:hypothetical protein
MRKPVDLFISLHALTGIAFPNINETAKNLRKIIADSYNKGSITRGVREQAYTLITQIGDFRQKEQKLESLANRQISLMQELNTLKECDDYERASELSIHLDRRQEIMTIIKDKGSLTELNDVINKYASSKNNARYYLQPRIETNTAHEHCRHCDYVTCNAVKTDSIILTITVDRVDLQRQWEIEKLKRITALEEMLKAVKKEMVGLEGT